MHHHHRALALAIAITTAGCAGLPVEDLQDRLPDRLPGPTLGQTIELAEPQANASGTLAVHVVDVGQGDATIWQLPGGGVALYDCGGDATSDDQDPVLRALEAMGTSPGDPITMLAVSHGHLDHVRECEEVLAAYEVQHVVDLWYTGQDRTQAYRSFQAAALASGASLHTIQAQPPGGSHALKAGDTLPIGSEAQDAGVVAQLLWPAGQPVGSWDGIAEASLVVRLSHGETDLCFQGDIDTEQEARILELAPGIDCEVQLVGHHGSAHASSQAWVEAVDPEVAIASTGPNPYGHPTSQALCRLHTAGAELHVTHTSGTVRVESQAGSISVQPDQPLASDPCQPGWDYWDTASQATDQPEHLGKGGLSLEATASSAEPCQHTDVTIEIRVTDAEGAPVPGANVTATWHYKTSSPKEETTTGPDGWANTTRYISGASTDHEVRVDVDAWTRDRSGQANATFQPQSC